MNKTLQIKSYVDYNHSSGIPLFNFMIHQNVVLCPGAKQTTRRPHLTDTPAMRVEQTLSTKVLRKTYPTKKRGEDSGMKAR